jgi:hypothetical protein
MGWIVRSRYWRLALGAGAALCSVAHAATVQHFEPLRAYRGASVSAAAKPAAAGPTTISFNAFSRDFVLELEPNGRLARMQARLSAGSTAYRGTIAGNPGSWARIVLTAAGPSGLVFDGQTLYGLEAGPDRSTAAVNGAAMFRLADVYFAPGELGSDTDAVAIDGDQAVAALAQEFTALEAAGATLNLDLGAVADFEFSQRFGADAQTALLTRVNNVDGLFSDQLGVQITVQEIDIFTANTDPFTTSAANALLDEVANYRGATPSQDAQGLTHLFTGRDLDGSTAGVAFLGAVCARRPRSGSRSFGSGLSESRRGAVVDSLVAAHEIGHNFGAPHDGDSGAACASTPTTFLMAPSINGSSIFSACSIEQMQPEIAAATCLTRIGAANVTVALPQLAQNVLGGVSFTHTATVSNTGADAAAGVTFTASAEQGLQIVAADAAGATCTVAATSATCAVGALSGGAARDVALTLRAASVGTFDLTATVDADVDENGTDNVETVTVTSVPVVDLVLSGMSPGVGLSAQTTINVGVANTTDFGATAVAVTATLSAGLRPDLATFGGAPCTITGQTIACSGNTLGAQTSAALVVTATAITAGAQQLTIDATASEAERTPADNQLDVAVNVSAPSSGGGGGSLSWLTVVLLFATQAVRGSAARERRRRAAPTPSGR